MMPRRHLASSSSSSRSMDYDYGHGATVPYSKWLLNTYCTLTHCSWPQRRKKEGRKEGRNGGREQDAAGLMR